MNNNEQIKMALEDVSTIKSILSKTKMQLGLLSSLFLWCGGLKLIGFIFEFILSKLPISNSMRAAFPMVSILTDILLLVLLVLYMKNRKKVKDSKNILTSHVFDLWGFIIFALPLIEIILIAIIGIFNVCKLDVSFSGFAMVGLRTASYIVLCMGILTTAIFINNKLLKLLSMGLIIIQPITLIVLGNFFSVGEAGVTGVIGILSLNNSIGGLIQMLVYIGMGLYFKHLARGEYNAN